MKKRIGLEVILREPYKILFCTVLNITLHLNVNYYLL